MSVCRGTWSTMTTLEEPAAEAIAEDLLALGRGDISLADALGMKRQVLDLMLEKALGLVDYGKLDQAETELDRLSLVDGRSPLPAFALGALRAERGDHTGAVDAYREAERRARALDLATIEGEVALCRAHALLAL